MTSPCASTPSSTAVANSLSLYIHIPFCARKCRYCDFASVADSAVSPADYVDTVVREMELREMELQLASVADTLYIGGGTPSLLDPDLIEQLITAAGKHFHLASNVEITLEANPGSVTLKTLAGYRKAGVNRLSLGVQSLDDRMLELLGRMHTAAQAKEAIALARSAGFGNIGIDLIHSLPGQSLAHWQQTLKETLMLAPEHLSVYGLSIEEGTPFAAMADREELALPDEELAALMFEATLNILPDAGFEHYEIANFARPGRRSRHNQVYWIRGNYLGFGAAAHSFLRDPQYGKRWHNLPEIVEYCRLIDSGSSSAEGELLLTKDEAKGEALFLGLRLLEGISPDEFYAEFGEEVKEVFSGAVARHLTNGFLEERNSRISLSGKGLLLANQLFIDFV